MASTDILAAVRELRNFPFEETGSGTGNRRRRSIDADALPIALDDYLSNVVTAAIGHLPADHHLRTLWRDLKLRTANLWPKAKLAAERGKLAWEFHDAAVRLADAIESRTGQFDDMGLTPKVEPEGKPRKLLTGWHDISAALDEPYSRRHDIRSLNHRCDGPITNAGQGTKPMVYRDALIEWWNGLTQRQAELANRRDGRKASADASHQFGKTGEARPEVGGGTKRRRST